MVENVKPSLVSSIAGILSLVNTFSWQDLFPKSALKVPLGVDLSPMMAVLGFMVPPSLPPEANVLGGEGGRATD